jgi:hypothetical protein
MERAAVELNGQALLAPQAIDLEALDLIAVFGEGAVQALERRPRSLAQDADHKWWAGGRQHRDREQQHEGDELGGGTGVGAADLVDGGGSRG